MKGFRAYVRISQAFSRNIIETILKCSGSIMFFLYERRRVGVEKNVQATIDFRLGFLGSARYPWNYTILPKAAKEYHLRYIPAISKGVQDNRGFHCASKA